MKNIMKVYFEKYYKYYEKEYDSKPLTTYTEDLNKKLIISEEDEDGYVEWMAKEQENKIDWDKLEKILQIKFNLEIKEYFSSYSFVEIMGLYKNINLWLLSVNATCPVEKSIRQSVTDGNYYFKDKNHFVLGGATVDGSDGYLIIYNNETQEVVLYDMEYSTSTVISESLKNLINNLEVV